MPLIGLVSCLRKSLLYRRTYLRNRFLFYFSWRKNLIFYFRSYMVLCFYLGVPSVFKRLWHPLNEFKIVFNLWILFPAFPKRIKSLFRIVMSVQVIRRKIILFLERVHHKLNLFNISWQLMFASNRIQFLLVYLEFLIDFYVDSVTCRLVF